jgi:hypothetical protein
MMKKTKTQDDITREMLSKIRTIQESNTSSTRKGFLFEEKEGENKKEDDKRGTEDYSTAIAITDEAKFGQNALTNQIQQFRSSVESGAQFSKVNPNNVSECPLIYMPQTGNLVFSGTIPCLNNLKWQFVLKTNTGNGCFLWADGLILNKDNMQILNNLFGFYQNWREQWNSESADLERMVQNLQNK